MHSITDIVVYCGVSAFREFQVINTSGDCLSPVIGKVLLGVPYPK